MQQQQHRHRHHHRLEVLSEWRPPPPQQGGTEVTQVRVRTVGLSNQGERKRGKRCKSTKNWAQFSVCVLVPTFAKRRCSQENSLITCESEILHRGKKMPANLIHHIRTCTKWAKKHRCSAGTQMCSLRKSEKHRDQNTASEEEHEEERAADDTQPSLTDEKSLSLSLAESSCAGDNSPANVILQWYDVLDFQSEMTSVCSQNRLQAVQTGRRIELARWLTGTGTATATWLCAKCTLQSSRSRDCSIC